MQLFSQQSIPLSLTPSRSAQLTFWPQWLAPEQASELLVSAVDNVPWQSDFIQIAGKSIPIPRLHCWYSHNTTRYKWSGIAMEAHSFPPWLDKIRHAVQHQTGHSFNSCLANYYRNGTDSVDWHADDEKILGPEPVVASLSLGAQRLFQLRHCHTRQRFDLDLPAGSLLLMGPGIQQYWHHRIPKSKQMLESRVNFTFRLIQGADSLS